MLRNKVWIGHDGKGGCVLPMPVIDVLETTARVQKELQKKCDKAVQDKIKEAHKKLKKERKENKKTINILKADNSKKDKDNSALIGEIGGLKEENKKIIEEMIGYECQIQINNESILQKIKKIDVIGASAASATLGLSLMTHLAYHHIAKAESNAYFNVAYSIATLLFASSSFLVGKCVNQSFFQPAKKIMDNFIRLGDETVQILQSGNKAIIKLTDEAIENLQTGRKVMLKLSDSMATFLKKSEKAVVEAADGAKKGFTLFGKAAQQGQFKPDVKVEVKDNQLFMFVKNEANVLKIF